MTRLPPSYPPARNPVTHQKHRQEVLWQITLPLGIGLLLTFLLMGLIVSASSSSVDRWADISLIWLLLPLLFVALILLLLTGSLVLAVTWLLKKLPVWASQIDHYFIVVGLYTRLYSDKAVEPVLRVHAFWASLQNIQRQMKRWQV